MGRKRLNGTLGAIDQQRQQAVFFQLLNYKHYVDARIDNNIELLSEDTAGCILLCELRNAPCFDFLGTDDYQGRKRYKYLNQEHIEHMAKQGSKPMLPYKWNRPAKKREKYIISQSGERMIAEEDVPEPSIYDELKIPNAARLRKNALKTTAYRVKRDKETWKKLFCHFYNGDILEFRKTDYFDDMRPHYHEELTKFYELLQWGPITMPEAERATLYGELGQLFYYYLAKRSHIELSLKESGEAIEKLFGTGSGKSFMKLVLAYHGWLFDEPGYQDEDYNPYIENLDHLGHYAKHEAVFLSEGMPLLKSIQSKAEEAQSLAQHISDVEAYLTQLYAEAEERYMQDLEEAETNR